MREFSSALKLSVLMPVYNERFLVEPAVRRVLAFSDPRVRELELVVVDDGSTDGTDAILRRLAAEHRSIRHVRQERNQGKGAALRRAIQEASGELCVVQDADLEYDPQDWSRMLVPFFEAGADAVYGSRFRGSDYARVLYFWHSVGNRLLTLLSNAATDLNLTDMETCYKMVRTELLKSIPLRSDDFAIEPEITAKLAKRGARVYEVPIRYAGRTYDEGKKIRPRDGLRALAAIARWSVIDDAWADDDYGAAILRSLSQARQFNRWSAEFIAKDVGARVLEIGAGIGNLTIHFIPRDEYCASDVSPTYLRYLRNLSVGRPNLRVEELSLTDAEAFEPLRGSFDTVICLNVLEHVEPALQSLRNIHSALAPGGKAIVLVPQGQWLYGSLDSAVEHVKRYERHELEALMREAGFEIASTRSFNSLGVLGWLVNGKLLRRTYFSAVQLKVLNTIVPVWKHLDALLPWHGLSLVVVGRKPEAASDEGALPRAAVG